MKDHKLKLLKLCPINIIKSTNKIRLTSHTVDTTITQKTIYITRSLHPAQVDSTTHY